MKKLKSEISNVRLKDLILASNRKEVVDKLLDMHSINEILAENDGIILPKYSYQYVEKLYERIYYISKSEYINDDTNSYLIKSGDEDFLEPWKEWLNLIDIENNIDQSYRLNPDKCKKGENLSVYFMLNCNIAKDLLQRPNDTVVYLLLHLAYIEELAKTEIVFQEGI